MLDRQRRERRDNAVIIGLIVSVLIVAVSSIYKALRGQ
jgi:hypothetical protein